ncbi:MAG: Alpha-L-fucosidase, partial [Verrucomicrobiales bacterium]|nr:Alpha-L-fucosidase [Verrucomicrobiales bacterium]
FGMFIHWGPVALRGQEISWSRGNQIPTAEYDALYKQFNPTGFNGGEWVRVAQRAGMKYMVFVAKHHDGFCEFNTALTDYSIMSPQSPFRRDVTKELVDSAHQLGMGIGLYYSPTDWYVGNNGSAAYLTQYTNQVVDELLSHYGRIETIWWDLNPVGADPAALLQRMRKKQPWILVNNRGDHVSMGDYDTPEQRVGAFDTLHAWESCMTIDGTNQWAWNPNGGLKPLSQLIGRIVQTADGGGNCLLNVGPRPDGIIDPPMVARLQEIGDWMGRYGESIYGTVGGPIVGGTWGGATHRGDTMYIHLKPFAGTVTLPGVNATIVSTASLGGGSPTVVQTPMAIKITLPVQNIDPLYTVLKMVLDPSRPVMHYRNLALGGAATQSATAFGGAPERAIDGNTDGNFNGNSVTHTDSAAGAWWSVDLGASYPIGYVSIYNRTDGLMGRLGDYNVILLDQGENPIWTSHQTAYPNPVANIDAGNRAARYVKIQLTGSGYLSLAEVQVLMDTLTTSIRGKGGARLQGARNVSRGKPVTPVFKRGDAGQAYNLNGGAIRK